MYEKVLLIVFSAPSTVLALFNSIVILVITLCIISLRDQINSAQFFVLLSLSIAFINLFLSAVAQFCLTLIELWPPITRPSDSVPHPRRSTVYVRMLFTPYRCRSLSRRKLFIVIVSVVVLLPCESYI
jgi:hypothetical protein